MSQQQQPSPTKRPRLARGTKHTAGKRVAATGSDVAAQPAESPEAPAPSPPSKPLVGEKWGESPSVERQEELRMMMEKWQQEPDHENRPGPFVQVTLRGTDVYWLAALTAGEGEVEVGIKKLKEPVINLSGLHLEGAMLDEAHLEGSRLQGGRLQGANLFGAHLEGADLSEAHLEGASLYGAHLEGANLFGAYLERAGLESVSNSKSRKW